LIAIVDTGVLYAATDRDDPAHAPCAELVSRSDLDMVVPALVVAEAAYFIGKRLGAKVEAQFLGALGSHDVQAPHPDDWSRIGELVEQYADFPLGGTDASIVALAERLGTDTVITLDRRHFAAVRPRHCESLQLLP
jgi:uncharacterized protein